MDIGTIRYLSGFSRDNHLIYFARKVGLFYKITGFIKIRRDLHMKAVYKL